MKRLYSVPLAFLLSAAPLASQSVKNNGHTHTQAQHAKECALWPEQNRKAFESILGKKAELFPEEGVIKFSFERPDIKIVIDKQELHPFMGSNTWIAFQKGIKPGVETMMMGHIALHDYEVNAAIDTALKHDLDVTSVHSHIFSDKPIYFIHINEEGNLKAIAEGVAAVIKTTGKKAPSNKKMNIPKKHAITTTPIEAILKTKGESSQGMFKVQFGRLIQASCGCPIGKSMGVHSWAAFGGTDANAVVSGDIVATEDEVQTVLKELRKGNATITALHNHMLGETPRLVFVHFFAQGKATDLATMVKNTLAKTGTLNPGKDAAECKRCPRK